MKFFLNYFLFRIWKRSRYNSIEIYNIEQLRIIRGSPYQNIKKKKKN